MSNHIAVFLLFSFLSCTVSGSFVQAAQSDDDYRDEITEHVVDPCFKYSAGKSEPIPEVSESEMVTLMKLMSPEAVQNTINAMLPVVKGKPIEARMEFYKFGLKMCIQGAGK